jgi:hypothetical protein
MAARRWWLTPVILATQEDHGSKRDPVSLKKSHPKNRAGGVAQDVGPESTSQYHTHKKP